MVKTDSTTLPSSIIANIIGGLGLLPLYIRGIPRHKSKYKVYMIVYACLVLSLYISGSFWFATNEIKYLKYRILKGNRMLFRWIRPVNNFVTISIILVSTSIQCYRRVPDDIIQNFIKFNGVCGFKEIRGKTKIIAFIQTIMFMSLIAIFLIKNSNISWRTINSIIARIYIFVAFELVRMNQMEIKVRYTKLNQVLMLLKLRKEIRLEDCSDDKYFKVYANEVIVLKECRCLYNLLGNTIQLMNTLHSWQLFACFMFTMVDIVFLPALLKFTIQFRSIHGYSIYDNTLISIVEICFRTTALVQTWSILYSSFTTTAMIKKASAIIISKLNHRPPPVLESELSSLLLQLPHFPCQFRVLGLFDLEFPVVLKLVYLISLYCLSAVELYIS